MATSLVSEGRGSYHMSISQVRHECSPDRGTLFLRKIKGDCKEALEGEAVVPKMDKSNLQRLDQKGTQGEEEGEEEFHANP